MEIKIKHSAYLLFNIVLLMPDRIRRWILHPFHIWKFGKTIQFMDLLYWWVEWVVLMLDVIGFPEIYELINMIFKSNIRFLTSEEQQIGRSLFGQSIDWSRVKLDDKAYIGAKSGGFAYVSFYMINYWGRMYESTFVHELTHVWQFEKFGSPYIVRALRAQFSTDKYNYGGLENLKTHLSNGHFFSELNYEQQGDVISDYYQIKNGRLKLRGLGKLESLEVYEQLLVEIGLDLNPSTA